MSTLADYLSFARDHPALFVNPSQGSIAILLDEDEIREAESQAAHRMEMQGMPVEWVKVGMAYQDQYILLLRDAVRYSDGSLGTCTRSVDEIERATGVVVLPVYQGQVLLIRHFRHEMRDWQLEIPQGFAISGLSTEESIRLELKEEIDAIVSRLIPLGHVHLDTSSGSNYIELFFANIDSYGELELQEGITELLPTPVSQVEQMIRESEITSTTMLVTYTRAKLKGLL